MIQVKIAAAHAIALLAREDVPDEVSAAYGKSLQYGRDYIIPAPFDPRLIVKVSAAVAKAAMDTGVAKKPIEDFDKYERDLSARLNPDNIVSAGSMRAFDKPQNEWYLLRVKRNVIRAKLYPL